jgi:hypothetical protein
VETESVQAATIARVMQDGEVLGATLVGWLSVFCAHCQRYASHHVPMVTARRQTRAHAASTGTETYVTDVLTGGRPTTATRVCTDDSCSTHISAICREGCDHGTCSTPGECDCNSHWTGARCNMCAIGFSGSDCNTGLIDDPCLIIKYSHLQRRMQERWL